MTTDRPAPTDEIEIVVTPEMIEAGTEVLYEYFLPEIIDGDLSPLPLLKRIFHAMASRQI